MRQILKRKDSKCEKLEGWIERRKTNRKKGGCIGWAKEVWERKMGKK